MNQGTIQGASVSYTHLDVYKRQVLELEGWTEKGRTDVEGGNYGYHSPRFRRDKGTGEILGLLPESIDCLLYTSSKT